jgi:hypothetical protein
MDTNKRKKNENQTNHQQGKKNLLENEALRCENELLKKKLQANSSRREKSASHNGIKA